MMGWDPKYASIRGQYRLTHCYISLDTLKKDSGIYLKTMNWIYKLNKYMMILIWLQEEYTEARPSRAPKYIQTKSTQILMVIGFVTWLQSTPLKTDFLIEKYDFLVTKLFFQNLYIFKA